MTIEGEKKRTIRWLVQKKVESEFLNELCNKKVLAVGVYAGR
jgi:hypothetical protein